MLSSKFTCEFRYILSKSKNKYIVMKSGLIRHNATLFLMIFWMSLLLQCHFPFYERWSLNDTSLLLQQT